MSSVSDSKVTFRAKALQHGIPESSLEAWEKSGIATYSQLLFRVASAPKLQALLDGMEPKADAVVTSAVHRLLFEAGTFVLPNSDRHWKLRWESPVVVCRRRRGAVAFRRYRPSSALSASQVSTSLAFS